MQRIHLYAVAIALTLAALCLGAIRGDLPLLQYLGNTTGVLLGFVLGVWWQEQEAIRQRKSHCAVFWTEFSAFLPQLENRLRVQIASSNPQIFESIIEYRLPLIELQLLRARADELRLSMEIRRLLSDMVTNTRILEEYVAFGADKLNVWHTNFSSRQQRLLGLIIDARTAQLRDQNATALPDPKPA